MVWGDYMNVGSFFIKKLPFRLSDVDNGGGYAHVGAKGIR